MKQETYRADAFRVLNFGGGVQSTALMHLILDGALPKPHLVVFADTGWETPTTTAHVEHCAAQFRAHGIRFETASLGDLRRDHMNYASGKPINSGVAVRDPDARSIQAMPLYTLDAAGKRGMLRRQCTERYKIGPINRVTRAALPYRRKPVEQWFGISTDEIERLRESRREGWYYRYPLIFDVPMSRADCERLNAERATPAPKSACVGCPYRDRDRWNEIRRDPAMWADAVAFDAAIRRLPGLDSACFLHSARVPLDEVDFGGPPTREEADGLLGECDGMCGT